MSLSTEHELTVPTLKYKKDWQNFIKPLKKNKNQTKKMKNKKFKKKLDY